MAVVMQHSLFFGGVDSSNYGVYISGEGVFNTPKRAVNMVVVPGRNGAVAIDQGYWENIDITYPAYISAPDLPTLASNLKDFRNAIAWHIGYQTLFDSFNETETREAVYVGGLEFEPIGDSTTVQFDLTFNCKPQRWLVSGMSAQSVSSGSNIYNDTQYDASPLLVVRGTGNVTVNGYSIDLDSGTFGNIVVAEGFASSTASKSFTLDSTKFNDTDTLTIPERTGNLQFRPVNYPTEKISSFTLANAGGCTSKKIGTSDSVGEFQMACPSLEWSLNTDHSAAYTCTASISTNQGTRTLALKMSVEYTASTHSLRLLTEVTGNGTSYMYRSRLTSVGDSTVNSTVPYLNGATYIDCDLGECYRYESGERVNLNPYINLGSDLPVLSPGANTVTYDSSITSVTITPRWWIL